MEDEMVNKKFFTGAVNLLITALVLVGCATTERATIDSYIDPNFSPANVKNLAVFPLRNARLAQSEALQINRETTQAIDTRNPAIKIIGASEAVELLNANGLAEKWAAFQINYAASGIPDAGILREIGAALGVDTILQGEIPNIVQRDSVPWSGYSGVGITRVTVQYMMMDVATNRTVWSATSDGIVQPTSNLVEAPPIIDAIRLAQNKILGVLPF
jgi:hypothetical protein